MNVIHLSPASPNSSLQALQEVDGFSSTDMGWGGDDRWTYRILTEEQITSELHRLSDYGSKGRVDYVTFQPCTSYDSRSQDRYVVENWTFRDGTWSFSAIFDGHGSHDTVDFVAENLPIKIRAALSAVLAKGSPSSAVISRLLHDAIIEMDNCITHNFTRLFPRKREELAQLSDEQIFSIMNHPSAGSRSRNILRCLQGSTALLTLVDPSGSHLWVTNLGDCRAVLVSQNATGELKARRITDVHNGGNPHELRRIITEHPGERECVLNNRILGFLAPTRVLGDTWMKLPAWYSRRILMKTKEFWSSGLSEDYVGRILTPPYTSNVPQVYYHRIRRSREEIKGGSLYSSRSTSNGVGEIDVALIMCSDGLVDLYEDQDLEENYYIKRWAAKMGESVVTLPSLRQTTLSHSCPVVQSMQGTDPRWSVSRRNSAVHLLRDAIGGDDIHRVSANLTVEMDERWMDDTTILVHKFL